MIQIIIFMIAAYFLKVDFLSAFILFIVGWFADIFVEALKDQLGRIWP